MHDSQPIHIARANAPDSVETKSFRTLSNEELLSRTRALAEKERRITLEVLHHLSEIDRRRAYAKLGYPSLWEYALKELKYSENAAYRRISAMRALIRHPELESKIRNGSLTVTAVSQVQTFLKNEKEQASKVYTEREKMDLFSRAENKSTREVTRELIELSPSGFRVQKERVITENRTIISFVADEQLLGKLHRVRDLSAARLKDPGSYPELVHLMSDATLDKIDPLRKDPKQKSIFPNNSESCSPYGSPREGERQDRAPMSDQTLALFAPKPITSVKIHSSQCHSVSSRYIPPSIRQQIWRESDGRCTYVEPKTGRRCNTRFGLEIEHCKPYALGGSSKDPSNLRLLCRSHNQLQAIETYGLDKMTHYLNRHETPDEAETSLADNLSYNPLSPPPDSPRKQES